MSSIDILQAMPPNVDGTAAWFSTMKATDFDSVCSSAIVMTLAEEQAEQGFISVRSVAVLVNAMRDRYRTIMEGVRKETPRVEAGESHHSATLNEWQARIIRRIPGGGRGKGARDPLGHTAIARLFPGATPMAVYKIRTGKTWKYLDRRAA